MYCCNWFKQLLKRTGEKGFSIIIDQGVYYLQARPFEQDVIDKYNSIDNKTKTNKWPELYDMKGIPVPWVFVLNIPLTYCPSCGAKLTEI